MANALITYSQRGFLPEEKCLEGIQHLEELPLRYIKEDWALIKDASALASKLGVAVYDAVYITAASNSGATMITADHILFKKTSNKAAIVLLWKE